MSLKLYHNCEQLPVRPFFKIFETGDLSHLLSEPKKRITKKDAEVLNDAWENIMQEYETLTKDNTYSMQMRITNNNIQRLNRIVGIRSALILVACGHPKGVEFLEYWGVEMKDDSVEEISKVRL